jgi:hypothetical protein
MTEVPPDPGRRKLLQMTGQGGCRTGGSHLAQ